MERKQEALTDTYEARLPDYTYYGVIPLEADGKVAIYDGDTLKLSIDLGMEHWSAPVYYRLFGIQAPEIRPLVSRAQGEAARDHLKLLVDHYHLWENGQEFPGPGYGVIVCTHKKLRSKEDYRPRACRGKFGRWLVEILGRNEHGGILNMNQQMIDDGFAEPYAP